MADSAMSSVDEEVIEDIIEPVTVELDTGTGLSAVPQRIIVDGASTNMMPEQILDEMFEVEPATVELNSAGDMPTTVEEVGTGTIKEEGTGAVKEEGTGTVKEKGTGAVKEKGIGTIKKENRASLPIKSQNNKQKLHTKKVEVSSRRLCRDTVEDRTRKSKREKEDTKDSPSTKGYTPSTDSYDDIGQVGTILRSVG